MLLKGEKCLGSAEGYDFLTGKEEKAPRRAAIALVLLLSSVAPSLRACFGSGPAPEIQGIEGWLNSEASRLLRAYPGSFLLLHSLPQQRNQLPSVFPGVV